MPLLGFGSNSHGQLGIGNTADIDVPTVCVPPLAEPPLCIAGGANHTLIVTAEGKVLTAGHNERGQLGISGHDCHEFTPIIIDIGPTVHISSVACGWDHSVALTTDGCVYVWGSNEYGQLGTGPDIKWSDKPRMLPTLTNVVKIACGMRFTVALTMDGKVWGWGANRYGELGATCSSEMFASSSRVNVIHTPAPLTLPPCKDIACGQHHIICLSKDNILRGRGRNKHGQLGAPFDPKTDASQTFSIQSSVDSAQLFCGWSFSGYVNASGKMVAWGRNDHQQLGLGGLSASTCPTPTFSEHLQHIKTVICGSEHALAVNLSGKCMAWGWNEHGNCGVGGTEDVTAPTIVREDGVKIIGSGYGHSFIYT